MILLRKILFFLLLSAASVHAAEVDPLVFNASQEFPNYLLPEQYRGMAFEKIPPEVIQKSRAQVEAAMASIFRRLTVPISNAAGETEAVKYFPYMQKILEGIHPGVQVVPSGGVVRSTYGYLYDQILEGLKIGVSPEQTLSKIASARADLPGFDVRGAGSDFDVLIRSCDGCGKAEFNRIQNEITRVTNSAETEHGFTKVQGAIKRSVFTIGDVKSYEEQIKLSTSQGGSTLDFLAFDVKKGKFIEPANQDRIVDRMLAGIYRYIAPESGENAQDLAKQTARGIRPRLELPFLQLENETQFRQELEALLKKLENGEKISDKALDQFNKMVRNARYQGAHNRIDRAAKDSLDALIQKISQLVQEKLHVNAIPIYGDAFPLGRKVPEVLRPYLISTKDFIKGYTHNGVLFHGTPTVENALAIIRGGFFVSDGKQIVLTAGAPRVTTAVYDRAVYTSADESVSSARAGKNGVVFPLRVKEESGVNTLDWARASRDPKVQKYLAEVGGGERSAFEVLAREGGIDNLPNGGHLLVLNTEIFEKPRFDGLLNAFSDLLSRQLSEGEPQMETLAQLKNLQAYGRGLGIKNLPSLQPAEDAFFAYANRALESGTLSANAEQVLSGIAKGELQTSTQLSNKFMDSYISFLGNDALPVEVRFPQADSQYRQIFERLERLGLSRAYPEPDALAQSILRRSTSRLLSTPTWAAKDFADAIYGFRSQISAEAREKLVQRAIEELAKGQGPLSVAEEKTLMRLGDYVGSKDRARALLEIINRRPMLREPGDLPRIAAIANRLELYDLGKKWKVLDFPALTAVDLLDQAGSDYGYALRQMMFDQGRARLSLEEVVALLQEPGLEQKCGKNMYSVESSALSRIEDALLKNPRDPLAIRGLKALLNTRNDYFRNEVVARAIKYLPQDPEVQRTLGKFYNAVSSAELKNLVKQNLKQIPVLEGLAESIFKDDADSLLFPPNMELDGRRINFNSAKNQMAFYRALFSTDPTKRFAGIVGSLRAYSPSDPELAQKAQKRITQMALQESNRSIQIYAAHYMVDKDVALQLLRSSDFELQKAVFTGSSFGKFRGLPEFEAITDSWLAGPSEELAHLINDAFQYAGYDSPERATIARKLLRMMHSSDSKIVARGAELFREGGFLQSITSVPEMGESFVRLLESPVPSARTLALNSIDNVLAWPRENYLGEGASFRLVDLLESKDPKVRNTALHFFSNQKNIYGLMKMPEVRAKLALLHDSPFPEVRALSERAYPAFFRDLQKQQALIKSVGNLQLKDIRYIGDQNVLYEVADEQGRVYALKLAQAGKTLDATVAANKSAQALGVPMPKMVSHGSNYILSDWVEGNSADEYLSIWTSNDTPDSTEKKFQEFLIGLKDKGITIEKIDPHHFMLNQVTKEWTVVDVGSSSRLKDAQQVNEMWGQALEQLKSKAYRAGETSKMKFCGRLYEGLGLK